MEISGIIEAGSVKEENILAEKGHSAADVGSGPALSQDGSIEVLSTPSLVAFLEQVSFQMIQEQLPEGLTSLGTSVQLNHRAATLIGSRVRLRAEISAVEGRRITLVLQAWEGAELVADGTHQRVVVERQDFLQRLQRRRDRQD